MKIIISCDSTCDLNKELYSEYNIKVMPLLVNLGEETYYDSVDIAPDKIYDYVNKTNELPKTAARSIFEYQEHFKDCLKEADHVIHIALSSEISSSYSNANIASQDFDNVHVIDSRSLSTGYGLLVLKACELAQEDNSPDYIVSTINELTSKVQASFIISNLKYLYKGGRCSAVAMFGANLLKIKPSIHVVDGKMSVGKKYMGKFEDAIEKYTNQLLIENPNIDKSKVFITYSSVINTEKIEQILSSVGFKKIYKTLAGCTIASHCGPECMGVLFLNN